MWYLTHLVLAAALLATLHRLDAVTVMAEELAFI